MSTIMTADADIESSLALDCSSIRLALFSDTFAPQVNGVARTPVRLSAALRERGGQVPALTPEDLETPRVDDRGDGFPNRARVPRSTTWRPWRRNAAS